MDSNGETSYTYNNLNMLLTAVNTQIGKAVSYEYDAVGNRTKETITTIAGNNVIEYTYNEKKSISK